MYHKSGGFHFVESINGSHTRKRNSWESPRQPVMPGLDCHSLPKAGESQHYVGNECGSAGVNRERLQQVAPEQTVSSVAPSLSVIQGGRSAGLGDGWALGGDYSVDEVYVRGSDKHGHSERPRVALPPHLWAEMCAIVASGRTPYKTPSDLIRDGAYHRMHFWREKLPELDWRQFDTEEALAAAERRLAKILGLDALVDANREILEAAFSHGAWGLLNNGIEEVDTLATQVEDQPWHDQLIHLATEYRQRCEGHRASVTTL